MLRLKRLEVEGFATVADTQVLDFPKGAGVTVVYGENMRGKTSLLNAIRYAFFGTVLGRGSRARRLHTILQPGTRIQGQVRLLRRSHLRVRRQGVRTGPRM